MYRSQKQKYQDYLRWFQEHVKDQKNWSWMRKDRDCANYHDHKSAPVPYEFGEAMFLMGNPKLMAKAISKKVTSNHQRFNEMSKYVNGDVNQGKLNPEYLECFAVTKKFKDTLRTYSGSPDFASDELFRISRESPDFYQAANDQVNKMNGLGTDAQPGLPEAKTKTEWRQMTWFEALIHWFKGGKVESVNETFSWRNKK